MSGGAELESVAAALALPAEDSVGSLLRIVVFVAIVVGPAILKAVKESARKKAEQRERRERSAPRAESADAQVEAPMLELEGEPESSGLENWERLMRGETASAPPAVPPPLPPASNLERAPRRRVLTETRALTEEQALTETPALTEARPVIAATPGRTLEDPTGYDGTHQPKPGLGGEFAGFAPQEGLASDREGGPTKRIGERASFSGGEAFQSLAVAGAQSEVTAGAAAGRRSDAQELKPRSQARMRMTHAQLRRTMQLAEILGPPVGVRAFDSGPTRPLGWS